MIQEFDYQDLGGGLNEGQPFATLNPNEATVLRNFYPFGRKLVRRGGVRKLTSVANWNENIFSMFPLKESDGTWTLLLGGATKLGKLSGSAIADLPSVLSIPSGSGQWCWFQYKDYAYTMRDGQTNMLRVDSSSWYTAGIAAPTVAPTIAQGAVGNLTAADYYVVFTFYNSSTGMESNPSPVSSKLTLAASKQIDWSAVQVSTNPFVDSRRLYRTLPGQVGEYFYIGTIPNNFDSTYTGDNVIIADMGRGVSYDNGVPPTQLKVGCIWRERLFATDNTSLYYSEYLLPECFGDESILSIYPDDGHQIRGLHAFGDRLVIGKTNKMHYLVGADANSFNVLTLSDRHGCMSHASMKSAEGMLFWYGSGNNFYRTDGNNVVEISTVKLRETLDAIPDSMAHKVTAAVFPALSWYVASIPQDTSGYNSKLVVYNYKSDSWAIFDHADPMKAPQYISDFYDENLEQVLYSTHYDGNVFRFCDPSVGTDNGLPIEAHWVGRADDFGGAGYRKFFKEVWVNVPQVSGGQAQLEAYYDEAVTPSLSRTVSLDVSNSAWKAFKMPTMGYPATLLRLGFKYVSSAAISLDGVHFKVGLLTRGPGQPR